MEREILILLAIIYSLIESYVDAEKISDGKSPSHTINFIRRIVVIYTITWLMGLPWIHFLIPLSAFYLIFDPALNLRRGKNFWYLGETALFDRVWDTGKILYPIELITFILLNIYL